MKLIKFSGMLCRPIDIIKDGDFRIKGIMNRAKDLPECIRYEYFASKDERDKRYNMLVNLLKEER